jgi:hypothetical protein
MTTNCGNCGNADAKFRCSRCKKNSYCNANCQKVDWVTHKIKCSAAQDTVKADEMKQQVVQPVLGHPIDSEIPKRKIVIVDGTKATQEIIPADQIDDSWGECIVPKMIGLQIKYKRWRTHTKKPDREVAIFLMVEPVSGLAAPEWQIGCGVVAFALENSDFSVQLFWDVYSYIFHLMDYYGENNFNYARFRKNQLNAQAFHEYQEEEHRIQGLQKV